MLLNRISYILTLLCNSTCTYCYEGVPTENRQLSNLSIDKFTRLVKGIPKADNWILEFIGGEPSLYNGWKYLYNVIKELSPNKIMIFTNGIILNPQMLNFVNHFHDKVEMRIQYNTSDISVVNAFKNAGCKIYEHIIIDKCFINSKKLNSLLHVNDGVIFILSEYRGLSDDLNYNDIIKYGEFIIKNNLVYKSGLKYLASLIDGKFGNSSACSTCMPYYEEIAIRPDNLIVPCSRWSHGSGVTSLSVDTDINTLMSEVKQQSILFSNVRNVTKINDNVDCKNCILYTQCNPCKINIGDEKIINENLFKSEKKCEYERMMFSSQLELYRLWKEVSVEH